MQFTPESIQKLPADPILGLNEDFKADPRAAKVNLGVGVYLDAQGLLPVMKAVQEAKIRYFKAGLNHGYGPMGGSQVLCDLIRELLLGTELNLQTRDRWASTQSLSGTGALNLGSKLLVEMGYKHVYVPQQTWGNHFAILSEAGFDIQTYPYIPAGQHQVDVEALKMFLTRIPMKSVVLIHGCCHNPTGADISFEDQKAILDIMQARQLIPFFDVAYQGLGEGLEEDARWVREAVRRGMPLCVAQSCSKIFGLYGERCGAIHVLAEDPLRAQAIVSHLEYHIRTSYSNPPQFGAHVVMNVLQSPELKTLWLEELTSMRERLMYQRQRLATTLLQLGVDMRFMTAQRGMFSLTGLSQAQMQWLRKERAVYGVDNSRICFSGLNDNNYAYVAESLAMATRQPQ